MSGAVLGTKNEKIVIFYTFQDIREFNQFKKSTDELIAPKAIHSSVFVLFFDDAADKSGLPQLARFNYLSKADFNFFGQIKDKKLRQILKEEFDTLFVFGNIDEKRVKRINQIKAKQRIVTNSSDCIKFDISINANDKGVEQIANFAKETLQKIQV
jgi:hypothetical protein